MSHEPAIKHCPDCHAPNPPSRTTCYACGQSLSANSMPAGAPGERTYPCLTCRGDIPYSAAVCPGCGRVLTSTPLAGVDTPLRLDDPAAVRAPFAREPQTTAPPPSGWKVEPLPDGTVRLTRGGWLRLQQDAAPAGLVALLLAFFVGPAALRRFGLDGGGPYSLPAAHPASELLLIVFGGVFVGISLLWFVWSVFGREELRAGSDLLEVRRELGPYHSARRLVAGSLRLDVNHRYAGRGARVVERRLVAFGGIGGRAVLERRSRSEMWDGMMPDEEPAALGRYLAAITGWPFLEPQPGRWS